MFSTVDVLEVDVLVIDVLELDVLGARQTFQLPYILVYKSRNLRQLFCSNNTIRLLRGPLKKNKKND
jgi:hypothetical protein